MSKQGDDDEDDDDDGVLHAASGFVGNFSPDDFFSEAPSAAFYALGVTQPQEALERVRRALDRLAAQGYVIRLDDDGWSVTDEGRARAEELKLP